MGSFARYVVACVALLVAAFVLEGGLPRLTRPAVARHLRARLVRRVRLQPVLHGCADQAAGQPRGADHRAQSRHHHRDFRSWCSRSACSARRWAGSGDGAVRRGRSWSRAATSASFASGGVGAGELFMFAAVISWALYTILGRKVLGGLSPLAATNYAALWGTLLLGAVAAPHFDTLHAAQFDWRMIVSLLYLGVLRHRAGLRLVLHVGQEGGRVRPPASSTTSCRCSAWPSAWLCWARRCCRRC